MVIDFGQLQAFRAHVLACYPEEACGVLVDGKFIACKNTAPEPTKHFQIAAEQLALIEVERGRVQAILHSHPYDKRCPPKWDAIWPSGNDMAQWLKGSIPWAIVSTEGETVSDPVWMDDDDPEPLEGRQFIHGINDCYSLLRDWYRLERGIVLPNYARGMEWWDRGLDLYRAHFQHAGFVEIPREQAAIGDCILIQVRAPVPNHAAVITGQNEILHHLFHRLSGRDRFDHWERFVAKYLRYDGRAK